MRATSPPRDREKARLSEPLGVLLRKEHQISPSRHPTQQPDNRTVVPYGRKIVTRSRLRLRPNTSRTAPTPRQGHLPEAASATFDLSREHIRTSRRGEYRHFAAMPTSSVRDRWGPTGLPLERATVDISGGDAPEGGNRVRVGRPWEVISSTTTTASRRSRSAPVLPHHDDHYKWISTPDNG